MILRSLSACSSSLRSFIFELESIINITHIFNRRRVGRISMGLEEKGEWNDRLALRLTVKREYFLALE